MTKLSVNVNKIATIRNSRGKNNPDVLDFALKIESYGAEGITVHPRPDGRHIRWYDVDAISKNIQVEFNIEGYPSQDFIERVIRIRPAQCTLVPDSPEVLTSNQGWMVYGNEKLLESSIYKLKQAGIRVSLFVDPYTVKTEDMLFFRDQGTDRIELYTEAYAEAFGTPVQEEVTKAYKTCAALATSIGLGINAGHDLDLKNLRHFAKSIPNLLEVSIGHALICDALEMGMKQTIFKYLTSLKGIVTQETLTSTT